MGVSINLNEAVIGNVSSGLIPDHTTIHKNTCIIDADDLIFH